VLSDQPQSEQNQQTRAPPK